ncbi:MAG: hypothetical protein ACHREM_19490 [Polyangiales bacterium]
MPESCRGASSRRSLKVALSIAFAPCFAASIAHAEAPVAAPSTVASAAPVDATPPPPSSALTGWGDIAVLGSERFGDLLATSAQKGSGGSLRGASLEVRSFNPVGWGGYYRWTTFTQQNVSADAYEVREIGIGVLRRLHSTGSSGSLVRTFSTFGFGATWSWVDTNLACNSSYVPFTARCNTVGYGTTAFLSGDSLGLEARLQLGMSISWVTIGAELGLGGWFNLTTSDNELTPPQWALTPTAAITVGIAMPYNDQQPVSTK